MENSIPVQIKQFSQPPAEPFDNSVSHSSGNGYKVTLVQSHPSSLDLKQPYKKRIIKQFLEKTTKNINPKRTFHPPSSAIILTMVTTISLLVQLNFAANLLLFMHFFKLLAQKMLKIQISSNILGVQHPNAGRDIQQTLLKSPIRGLSFRLFYILHP